MSKATRVNVKMPPGAIEHNPAKNRKVPTGVRGLHKHIATGGKPATYKGCQGVNPSTVPGVKAYK